MAQMAYIATPAAAPCFLGELLAAMCTLDTGFRGPRPAGYRVGNYPAIPRWQWYTCDCRPLVDGQFHVAPPLNYLTGPPVVLLPGSAEPVSTIHQLHPIPINSTHHGIFCVTFLARRADRTNYRMLLWLVVPVTLSLPFGISGLRGDARREHRVLFQESILLGTIVK